MSPVFRHGSLRLYLLRLLDEEPRHGYEVIRLLRDRFMGVYSPSPGTIYPRLARLEEEGLVTHDEVDGRKVYRITEAGRDELRSRSDELDELEEELSASVSDIVREVREDVRQTVRSLREELTWAARESRRMGREMASDVREQAKQARDEAREQAKQARDDAREQVKQAKEQAREQARQAHEDARGGRDRARDSGESREERGGVGAASGEGDAASGGEGPGPEAARRVHEQARRLREEARRARDEAIGAGRLGDPVGAGFRADDHDWDPPGGSGWGQGPGWTDWPGRRGWEDWARMRGRPGWPGGLDFGTLRDLERVAVQFTSDLRRVAMQSSAAGENVITDLRTILEDALDRIKSEIFGPGSGPGHEEAEGKDPGTAAPAGSPDDASADAPVADASVTDDTPPAGDAGKPAGKD
ncbi:MAG TPA: helix-turn-helix transcriptional regulator [Streptosporangiaceae bacterium]|nr:helix-turn-helix transcriptional regulator [Streptosporangiaceae bacterium]